MTAWARLTWQARDPVALAADLERRMGVVVRPGGTVTGSLTIDLVTAGLELRPWQRESPGDEPRMPGRLVFEPVSPEDEARASDGAPAAGSVAAPLSLVGVGWATVELDRAEAELDPWLEPRDGPGRVDVEDPLLGACARLRGAGALPAGTMVLLEPTTEGRLAASLARDGEGPCALYLAPRGGLAAWRRAARARGVLTGAVRPGPLGPATLLPGGRVAGPHLIVVDRQAR